MRRAAALLVLFGAALAAPAAAPPVEADDRLDYLFLGKDRPFRLRMHLRLGDRPYGSPWVEFIDRLFDWFDRDGDGFLSPSEATRIPSPYTLDTLAEGRRPRRSRDGKVSRDEFRFFFRYEGMPGYRLQMADASATVAGFNEELFAFLDRTGEGHLTADKVARLAEKLRPLDANDDEMIDEKELAARFRGRGIRIPPGLQAERIAYQVEPDQMAIPVRALIRRYDRDKDQRLSRAEIGLPPADFAKLDANGDGVLDYRELMAYLANEPDLVLRVRVGEAARVSVVGARAFTAKTLRREGDGVAFELGNTHMSIQVSPEVVRLEDLQEVQERRLDEFDRVAGKGNSVRRADLVEDFSRLRRVFSQADRDGDGKLTRDELTRWYDLVASGRGLTTCVSVRDFGGGLFTLLDADGDARLSAREMKDAWARLKPFARGGKVAPADLPRTVRVAVGLGEGDAGRRPFSVRRLTTSRLAVTGKQAPAWFRKMDRNDDGDVSPREWLGTAEDFAKIDADGDGLLSADEAIAFEAKKARDKE